jgi:hypothetical protein
MFCALRALADAGEIDLAAVQVHLCLGSIPERQQAAETARSSGVSDCVRVAGPVSRSEALDLLRTSDLLLLLAEGRTFQIPGKTYEYLKSGKRILALTPANGALGALLAQTGGAWVADPSDNDSIVQAIRGAYVAWKNALASSGPDPEIVATFDRRLLAGRFTALFRQTMYERRELTRS